VNLTTSGEVLQCPEARLAVAADQLHSFKNHTPQAFLTGLASAVRFSPVFWSLPWPLLLTGRRFRDDP